jgi:hypothetical protein
MRYDSFILHKINKNVAQVIFKDNMHINIEELINLLRNINLSVTLTNWLFHKVFAITVLKNFCPTNFVSTVDH